MEKEIKVPSFVNDNYEYHRQQELFREKQEMRNEKKRIRKLNFYRGISVFLAGAATGFVIANASTIENKVKMTIDHIVDMDNERFEKEAEIDERETELLTGRTREDIMDSGKQIH